MSIIARLCLVIALLLGGASIFFSKQVGVDIAKLRDSERDAKLAAADAQKKTGQAEAALKAKQDELAKAEDDTKKVQQQLAEATAKTTTLQTQIDDLNDKIKKTPPPVADTKELDALKAKLAETEKARDDAAKQVKDKTDEVKALTDKAAVLEGEKKLLVTKGKEMDSKLKLLKGEEGWEMPLPEGFESKVLFYDKTWNFVVLDSGKKKGAVENGVVILHRGTEILGPARVSSLDDDACIADYMGDYKKKEPRPGDIGIPKR